MAARIDGEGGWMRRALATWIGPLIAGLLCGCAAMSPAASAPSLDGTAWVLSELPGHAPSGGAAPTLAFAEGRVHGSDGCNRYGAAYGARGAALEIAENMASTQMACTPEVMEHAAAFLASLRATKSYRVVDGALELLGADGALRARLAAQPRGLAGTSWRVTGINNGQQAVRSVQAGSEVTLAFDAEGGASGSAGCNRYRASVELEGTSLRFGPAAVTRMLCAEAGVMEQEQQFLAALSRVTTLRREGDRLELRDAEGALWIAAEASTPD
jgi:heat shock protein HslJ